MANFLAPAKEERKVTSATRIAPGSSSCMRARSCQPGGSSSLGSPEGTSPTFCTSSSVVCLHAMAVTTSNDNSLKSPRNFKRRCSLASFFALKRNARQTMLSKTVAGEKSLNSHGLSFAICIRPPVSAFGRPIIGFICETMMRMADAVMKPLRAGRDKKRTRKASRKAPISAMTKPTNNVKTAPARVRSSSELLYFISCSPVRRLTRPPVPTEEWMHVPKRE
mmetsp:Transcript_49517/g.117870  ORF Transcript_49517/g.117870 Transcript_49517/m.117870 type:complete len:222 (+) Transcript_49517:1350-2015(+)